MSAKPLIWHVVVVVVLGCVLAAAGCARTPNEPSSLTQSTPDQELDTSDVEAMRRLEAIGYLDGFEQAKDTGSQTVTVHDTSRAYQGLNLYCSGHDTEAVLMDMDGNILHRWRRTLNDFWPEFERTTILQPTHFWRRVHLFEDGSLLALFDGIALIKLDKDSQLIGQYRNRPHHDFFVNSDGSFVVLTRKAMINLDYHDEEPILEDFVTFLDKDGEERRKISILKAIENSDYRALLNRYRYQRFSGNILHTNTLEVLDGTLADRIPAFRRGNILLSILKLDTIAVLDPDREKIVWAITGLTLRQHQPTLLPNGRMLVYDNQGVRLVRFDAEPGSYTELREAMARGGARSRILEFDPVNQSITWRYDGDEDNGFYSYDCGSLQPLPNGNVLVTESNTGRAFELNRARKIVWEFVSPHRTRHDETKTANLFELLRIEPEYVSSWLDDKG